MDNEVLNEIVDALNNARYKHPHFADNLYHAVSLATEELGELAKAVNDGDPEGIKAEALDTIAVLVRIIYRLEGK